MATGVLRFASRADRLERSKGRELRQLVLALQDQSPRAVREIVAVIDRNTAAEKGWSFVMLGPMQNRAVVLWIDEYAKRPRISARLWAEFFCRMRMDTGEICMSRSQMAEAVGALPRDVSSALSELVECGAIIRRQEGRDVRWFMNPMIGTCLTGAAREDAQRRAPRLYDPPPRPPRGGGGPRLVEAAPIRGKAGAAAANDSAGKASAGPARASGRAGRSASRITKP